MSSITWVIIFICRWPSFSRWYAIFSIPISGVRFPIFIHTEWGRSPGRKIANRFSSLPTLCSVHSTIPDCLRGSRMRIDVKVIRDGDDELSWEFLNCAMTYFPSSLLSQPPNHFSHHHKVTQCSQCAGSRHQRVHIAANDVNRTGREEEADKTLIGKKSQVGFTFWEKGCETLQFPFPWKREIAESRSRWAIFRVPWPELKLRKRLSGWLTNKQQQQCSDYK